MQAASEVAAISTAIAAAGPASPASSGEDRDQATRYPASTEHHRRDGGHGVDEEVAADVEERRGADRQRDAPERA
jgi:hypothetical protein